MLPKPHDSAQQWEPYNCEYYCRGSDRQWKHQEREQRGCTRADLDPVPWDVDISRMFHYMGREDCHEYNGKLYHGHQVDYRYMPEDPDDGCPGGWYRCRYIYSLMPYFRLRTQSGDRVENLHLRHITNSRIIEAVHYFEGEREAAIAYWHERVERDREAKQGG